MTLEEGLEQFYGAMAEVEEGEDSFVGPTKGWPIVSNALAVHVKRRQEAIDDAVAKGVPTEFTRQGQPILRDRAHRRAYCKAYGFHDRNGGYGDA